MNDKYRPDIAIIPGVTLVETVEIKEMTFSEFSRKTGLSHQEILAICVGKDPITSEIAMKLEEALGVPASFWNNLEANYQETLKDIEAHKESE